MRGKIEDGPILRKIRIGEGAIAVLEDYIYSKKEMDERTRKAAEISVAIETTLENLNRRKKGDEWYLDAMESVLSHLPKWVEGESEEYFQYRIRTTRYKVEEFVRETIRKEEKQDEKEITSL